MGKPKKNHSMLSITLLELFFSNSAGRDAVSCQLQASFCVTAYL